MFEGVLPVLLLGADVLLQQAEDVTGLREKKTTDEIRKCTSNLNTKNKLFMDRFKPKSYDFL